MLKEENQAN